MLKISVDAAGEKYFPLANFEKGDLIENRSGTKYLVIELAPFKEKRLLYLGGLINSEREFVALTNGNFPSYKKISYSKLTLEREGE
jgi:hypothetical protein